MAYKVFIRKGLTFLGIVFASIIFFTLLGYILFPVVGFYVNFWDRLILKPYRINEFPEPISYIISFFVLTWPLILIVCSWLVFFDSNQPSITDKYKKQISDLGNVKASLMSSLNYLDELQSDITSKLKIWRHYLKMKRRSYVESLKGSKQLIKIEKDASYFWPLF
jgi:hypothetical protein